MADDREEQVRRRAYELWEQEGRPHGRHDEHWAAANAAFADPGDDVSARSGVGESEDVAAAVIPASPPPTPAKRGRKPKAAAIGDTPETAPAEPEVTGARRTRRKA